MQDLTKASTELRGATPGLLEELYRRCGQTHNPHETPTKRPTANDRAKNSPEIYELRSLSRFAWYQMISFLDSGLTAQGLGTLVILHRDQQISVFRYHRVEVLLETSG